MTAAPAARFRNLDGLRGIAVLLVVLYHAPARPWLFEYGGWTGVDLFFVLSGFLVSGLLFREHLRYGSIHPGRFLIRRGLKIYPAFYFFLAAFVFEQVWLAHRRLPTAGMVGEALFVQSYGHSLWAHTWSLAVEEHFYFTLALGLFLASRAGRAQGFAPVAWVCVAIIVISPALRLLGTLGLFPGKDVGHMTHYRLDALSCGVLVSYMYHFRREWLECRVARAAPALPLVAVALVGLGLPYGLRNTAGLSLISFGYATLLVATLFPAAAPAGMARLAGALSSPLAWIGPYTYSIYLWHLPATRLVGRLVPGAHGWMQTVAAIAASVAVGCAAAALIEYPVLRLRDRLFPSRSGRLAVRPVQRGVTAAGH